MTNNIARNGLKLFTVALIMYLLAKMTLGNNEIYQLGTSFGEALRSTDDDLDLKDLDYELQELAEQFGLSPMAAKLFESDDFTDGATFGYYKQEILGQ